MTSYICAFEITRTFTASDINHDPDPEEVMAILVRQVEAALRTVSGMVGTVTFKRLYFIKCRGWE